MGEKLQLNVNLILLNNPSTKTCKQALKIIINSAAAVSQKKSEKKINEITVSCE